MCCSAKLLFKHSLPFCWVLLVGWYNNDVESLVRQSHTSGKKTPFCLLTGSAGGLQCSPRLPGLEPRPQQRWRAAGDESAAGLGHWLPGSLHKLYKLSSLSGRSRIAASELQRRQGFSCSLLVGSMPLHLKSGNSWKA